MDISAAMFHALNRHAWFFDVYNFCLSAENLKKKSKLSSICDENFTFQTNNLIDEKEKLKEGTRKSKMSDHMDISVLYITFWTQEATEIRTNHSVVSCVARLYGKTRRNPTTFHNFLVTQNNFAIPVLEHLQRNFANQRLMAFTNLKPM